MNQDVSQSESRSAYGQGERLIQIGAVLQQHREDQNVDIGQIAAKTMISARHLRAIETGDLASLPEAVYVRGFIRRYADFLGLNGKEMSLTFPLYSDARPMEPTWQNSDAAQLRQTHLYLAYVALITVAVIGLGAVLTRLSNGDRPGQPRPTVVEAPQSGNEGDAAADGDGIGAASDSAASDGTSGDGTSGDGDELTEANAASTLDLPDPELVDLDPAIASKPVRVKLELKERSWLRVVVDGRQDFEGVLPEGTERVWAGDSNVVVRAGNAGGVLATLNSAEPEVMGEAGAVQERVFAPDSGDADSE